MIALLAVALLLAPGTAVLALGGGADLALLASLGWAFALMSTEPRR